MAQKKKLTKRQLLNELLANDEAERKLEASFKRLSDREERLTEKRRKLSDELGALLHKEQEKAEGSYTWEIEPIVFKNHVFKINRGGTYYAANCKIDKVKSVK